MRKGVCALCLKENNIHKSHIIPKFIYKWLKETSVTGFMRDTRNINKRSQDGLKYYLLCNKCENIFSEWENYFFQSIFKPLLNSDCKYKGKVKYNEKFLLFCISLSWRYLTFLLREGYINHFPQHILIEIENALTIWKNFILGVENSPGKYEHYFYDFSGTHENTPTANWHMYLQRSVDPHVTNNGTICLVYIKLPNFLIVSYATPLKNSSWLREKRVCVKEGYLAPGNYTFPKELFDIMIERAKKVQSFNSSISSKQKEVIEKDYSKNKLKLKSSETFNSSKRDLKIFE